jgi:hypothetical protein
VLGISGVESGKAAPLVGGPPDVELHMVVDELPSGDTGDMVPVVLPRVDEGMVPSGVVGIIASGDIVVADAVIVTVPGMDVETEPDTVDGTGTGTGAIEGNGRGGTADSAGTGMVEPGKMVVAEVSGCWENVSGGIAVGGSADVAGAAETDGVIPTVAPVADVGGVVEITVAVGVPGVICPVGTEQVTTVPGVAGSEASGTGANVVSGAPGCVVAEKGLGPLRGEVTIVAGVDGRPMAVVPMVETCAMQA